MVTFAWVRLVAYLQAGLCTLVSFTTRSFQLPKSFHSIPFSWGKLFKKKAKGVEFGLIPKSL